MNHACIYKDLCQIAGEGAVLRDEPMSRHTTFRVGGPADFFVTPDSAGLPGVTAYCREHGIPCLVIGNGSNLLCGDGGMKGVVVEIGKRMSDIRIEGTKVSAEAGALLSAIAARAAEAGLTGFEFAAGIPGSIGGAAVMNAGAYGGEIRDILTEAEVLTEDGEIGTISADDLEFSYRHSVIPEKNYIVLRVILRLREGNPKEIYARMAELKEARVSKQPLEYPSAGSTFKRPEGYFAGKLIEDAGLKGYSRGGAQVSEKHCGFVINRGQATAEDIRALMEHIQQTVREKYGVDLEPEVKFIGKFRTSKTAIAKFP
ncbi:MAG: UDP-N-acetylmuramate dehydrogenase [Clostridiales bacterium]|nr:UDP-N-acetylmuramate dehydrogenase [Clostridiales bacterium]